MCGGSSREPAFTPGALCPDRGDGVLHAAPLLRGGAGPVADGTGRYRFDQAVVADVAAAAFAGEEFGDGGFFTVRDPQLGVVTDTRAPLPPLGHAEIPLCVDAIAAPSGPSGLRAVTRSLSLAVVTTASGGGPWSSQGAHPNRRWYSPVPSPVPTSPASTSTASIRARPAATAHDHATGRSVSRAASWKWARARSITSAAADSNAPPVDGVRPNGSDLRPTLPSGRLTAAPRGRERRDVAGRRWRPVGTGRSASPAPGSRPGTTATPAHPRP